MYLVGCPYPSIFLPFIGGGYIVRMFSVSQDGGGEGVNMRIQDNKEVTAVIENIRDIQKRTDMQVWHKDSKTKLIIHV